MLNENLKHFFISLSQNVKSDNTFFESTFAEDGKKGNFGSAFSANPAT